MTANPYSDVWNLEVIFKGGSESNEFADHLTLTTELIELFQIKINSWTPLNTTEDSKYLQEILKDFEHAAKKLRQSGAFVACLQAQNTDDKKAHNLEAKVTSLSAAFQTALSSFDSLLTTIDDDVWTHLLADEHLNVLSYILSERRDRAKDKLSREEEAIISALGVDGYHSWGQLYDLIVGKIKIPFYENGEEKLLSVGQAFNKFSSSDREIRTSIFKNWEKAWGGTGRYFSKNP